MNREKKIEEGDYAYYLEIVDNIEQFAIYEIVRRKITFVEYWFDNDQPEYYWAGREQMLPKRTFYHYDNAFDSAKKYYTDCEKELKEAFKKFILVN